MNPIITSLLDTDKYKFLAHDFIERYYPNENARYDFFVRGGVNPLEHIDLGELREQLEAVRVLGYLEDREKKFLMSLGIKYKLPFQLPSFTLTTDPFGKPVLYFEGRWAEVCMWETYAMSIISEMYGRDKAKPHAGNAALSYKVQILENSSIDASDFGTRRRHSREWHEQIIAESGLHTSNVFLAHKYSRECVGTMPHEVFMGVAGLYDHSASSLRGSQQVVLKQWEDLHGATIALTDTWGSNFFFRDFTDQQARKWIGLRQDSGHPYQYTQQALKFWSEHGDPHVEHTIVYSDALRLVDILSLVGWFKDTKYLKQKFGWGTNLTNDCGYEVPKMVVKLTEINGRKTVKLSDTPGKEQGPLKKINKYRAVFSKEINDDRSQTIAELFGLGLGNDN